jgi:AGZA family xanthine/uracil permease-like MFS transporter
VAAAAANGDLLDRQFKMSQRGTNIRTELMGGLTTFMVMSYIIAVNPSILNLGGGGLDVTQVATVTCLVAGVMSIAMGLYANIAVAIAPGLGINAIVAFTLVGSMGLSFPEAMGVVVAEGIIITLLVITGVRKYVMDVVPMPLKQAISVGIGFFILFIGLTNAGLITYNSGVPDSQFGTSSGLLGLTPLNTWPIFVVMVGLLVTIVLLARNHKAALLIGILAATVTAFIVPNDVAVWPDEPMSGPDFNLIGNFSFDFIGELGILTALLVVLSLMLADFFDTMGTLIGVGSQAGYLDEDGNLPDAQKPLLVDSLAAVAGGAASASSATSYIESSAGVGVGGRTGLVSVTTGVLFLLALPFVAIVNAIPAVATAPALIVVGVLMVGVLGGRSAEGAIESVKERGIDFSNLEQALPVVVTMLMMPLTYNITNGIGAGFVTWVVMKVAAGHGRRVHPALYVIAAAFLLYFLRWALFDAKF